MLKLKAAGGEKEECVKFRWKKQCVGIVEGIIKYITVVAYSTDNS